MAAKIEKLMEAADKVMERVGNMSLTERNRLGQKARGIMRQGQQKNAQEIREGHAFALANAVAHLIEDGWRFQRFSGGIMISRNNRTRKFKAENAFLRWTAVQYNYEKKLKQLAANEQIAANVKNHVPSHNPL